MASGDAYLNFGWILTQFPKFVPFDGSTIHVFIDGQPIGTVDYNHFRQDIASLFPGLENSDGAVGFRVINTTTMTNGTHTISWSATDSAGRVAGIGSRFFTVSNAGAAPPPQLQSQVGRRVTALKRPAADDPRVTTAEIEALPADPVKLVGRRGWDLQTDWRSYEADASGQIVVTAEELDRVELWLKQSDDNTRYTGYQRVGSKLVALPIGAKLDEKTGQFTWAPGVGFLGSFDLVFVQWKDEKPVARHEVRVSLRPIKH